MMNENKNENRKHNCFVIPINVSKQEKQWNYFKEMRETNCNRVETFLYKEPMKTGDCVLLYMTKKGLESLSQDEKGYGSEPGIYAVGRILASHPYIMTDSTDKNYGETVVQVDIEYFNLEEPFEGFPKEAIRPYPHGKPFAIKDEYEEEVLKAVEKAKEEAQCKPF